MSVLSTGVWKRRGADEMSRNVFYLVLGSILAWGFALTMLVAQATAAWKPGLAGLLLVGLGIPVIGIVFIHMKNVALSFVGYNLIVVGLAAILGPLLAEVGIRHPGLVERAALMTALVSSGMGVSGMMFPNFYRSIGGALFVALIVLVIISFARLFIPALQEAKIIDYFGAGLFSLYIGYDMWRASTVPATLNSAVEVGAALFLDVFNLFLYMLNLAGDD